MSLKTVRFASLRDCSTPSGGKEASISSMERALRTLTPPQTPRQNSGRATNNHFFKSNAAKNEWPHNDSSGSEEEAVRVAIRVKPLAGRGDAGRAWRAMTDRNSIVEIGQKYSTPRNRRRGSGDLEYVYDEVFEEQTNTCQIYSDIVSDMVHSVTKEGRNGTVFAYGQTSSGKTFTMQGCDDSDSTGIIQLAANDIFRHIKEEKDAITHSEYSVRVSYVEIYNEELRDLLTDNKRKSSTTLVIREDKRGSISVEGLKEIAVNSLEQLMEVFRVGEANKSVGSTKMNDRSSRSHAILKIILERKTVLNPSDLEHGKENSTDTNASEFTMKTISSLNLVDLAGSESVRHTGATGQQKKEGGMINQR